MGKVDISFAASAVSDLEEIRIWYADQGVPDVGKRLIGEIFQRIENWDELFPSLTSLIYGS